MAARPAVASSGRRGAPLRPILPPLLSLAAAGLWCAALLATGARLRRLARLPAAPGLRLAIDFVLGSWGLACAALGLGLAGAFRPAPLLLLAGAIAAAGRWTGQGWRWRPFLGPALAAIVFLPVALAPPFFYDALVYHLALPWQALLEGRIVAHPESFYASFPPLSQLVAAGPLAAGLDRVPALLHLAAFTAAGAALAVLASRLGAPAALALPAGAALLLLPGVVPAPGFPAAEGWALAGIGGGLAAVVSCRDDRGRAVLAGLLLGCASAARLQALPWTIFILAILAATSRWPLRRTMVAALGWLAGSAPWWLKNLILLRDPLSPIGWRGEGLRAELRDASVLLLTAAGPGDFVAGIVRALGGSLVLMAPLLLAAAVWLVGSHRPGGDRPVGRSGRRAWLLAATVPAGILAWGATGAVPRFLAPVFSLLLAVAAAAGRRRTGRLIGGLALAAVTLPGLALALRDIGRWGGAGLAVAAPASVASLVVNDPRPAFVASDRLLPAGARVLFVGEPRAYPFPRRFVAPSPYDVSPLRDPLERLTTAEDVRRWLVEQGFTHLLVNRAELVRLSAEYPALPWTDPDGRRRFQELLDLLEPAVVMAGEIGVFALGPGG
jgi:hypothetical protein